MSLSSPGHAVSPFRGEPFWERFRVRSRGFARRDAQTQRKVPTVHFEGNWRCKLSPKAAKSSFFIGSGRNVWEVQIEPQSCIILFFYRFWTQRLTLKIIPTQVEKTVSLSSPGHAVSPFRGEPFWERFRVRSRGFARRDAQTQRKVPTVHFEGNWRCKLSPKAAKSSFFIGSGRNVWEVQIEPQSCIILFFYRFWTQRLTLKIIPTQVEKRCP